LMTLAGDDTVGSLMLAGTLGGNGTLTAATYALNSGTANANLGAGALTSTGSSTLAGTSAAGTVNVSTGTLALTAADRLLDSAAVTVAGGAALNLNGNDRIGTLALAGTLGGSGTLSAASYALSGGTVNADLGSGALTSTGNSTLVGSAAVDSVSVDSGTLVLASAQRLTALPAVGISNGAQLAMTGDQAFGTLAGAGDLALASYTLSTGSGGDSIFSGVLSGSGGLIKQGSSSIFTLSGANTYSGRTTVQAGTLRVGDGATAGSLATSDFVLQGTLSLARSDAVTLAQAITGSGSVEQAGSGTLSFSGSNKDYSGGTRVLSGRLATLNTEALPDSGAVTVAASASLVLGGAETLGSLAADGTVQLAGNLTASGALALGGAVIVDGGAAVALKAQRIDAVNEGNRWGSRLALEAGDAINISSGREGGALRALTLGAVTAGNGGQIDAGLLTLDGVMAVNGSGTLNLASDAAATLLAPDAALNGKQALNLPVALTADVVQQTAASRINVAAGAGLSVVSTQGGSIQLLRPDNSFLGSLSVVSGSATAAWTANATSSNISGSSITYALQNRVQVEGTTVNVGGAGIIADLVDIRADRLATVGPTAAIVARLPFDATVGTATSLPALTLELTPVAFTLNFPFGATGAENGIRVNIGSQSWGNRTLPLDAGYMTVLPRGGAQGSTAVLLTGPAVNAGGGYRFFFDGAGRQGEIPVFYNGLLPTTPAVENSISATVSVSEGARKERFEEAVRTENVAVRLRAGVIAEVGPAPSATLGTEGIRTPAACAPGKALACAAAP
jgi:autotransporter-associated beta strand protein